MVKKRTSNKKQKRFVEEVKKETDKRNQKVVRKKAS